MCVLVLSQQRTYVLSDRIFLTILFQIADLTSKYTSAKHEMEQLRRDSKSKEKKKSVNKVNVTSPVGDMEQWKQYCCVLEDTVEVGMLSTWNY